MMTYAPMLWVHTGVAFGGRHSRPRHGCADGHYQIVGFYNESSGFSSSRIWAVSAETS